MTITMSVRENTLRCNINAQIKLLDAIWERLVISASLRSAGAAITKYKGLIRDLETESLTQIGKIVDDAERDLNQNDWCTFLLDVEGKIDAHQHQLDTKQGLAPASSELLTAKSAQHENRSKGLSDMVDSIFTQINQLDATKPLTKLQFQHFDKEIEDSRTQLENLNQLATEIVEADPVTYADLNTNWSKESGALEKRISDLAHKMTLLNIPETSMVIQRTSTPNQTLISTLNPGLSASSTPNNFLKLYGKQQIPTFSKDYSKNPDWRNERHTLIMPGQDEAWLKRVLNDSTPKDDDLFMFSTLDECWQYLDETYASDCFLHPDAQVLSDEQPPGCQ